MGDSSLWKNRGKVGGGGAKEEEVGEARTLAIIGNPITLRFNY